jgi:hypothetical protein
MAGRYLDSRFHGNDKNENPALKGGVKYAEGGNS